MDYKTYEVREWFDGTIEYYKDNKRHREDGPAIEHIDGGKYWYKNGKQHREDGPAVESYSGVKYYYINGVNYTKEEYCNKIYVDKFLKLFLK